VDVGAKKFSYFQILGDFCFDFFLDKQVPNFPFGGVKLV
jgi:hypothetical protein